MRKDNINEYYFSSIELTKIRDKYFAKLKEIVGLENLLNNQNLTSLQLSHKQNLMFDKILNFILSDKEIRRDFYDAYGVVLKSTLANFVLESLVGDEVVKNNLDIDIFLDDKSILFCGEDCPMHIFLWYTKGVSLYQYSSQLSHYYDDLESKSKADIFGLEFV